MKRYWSTIADLPIVTADSEEAIGKMHAAFMHPETGQFLAFLVTWTEVIAPRDICKWGRDAVWIRSKNDLIGPEEVLRIREYGLRKTLLVSKKVLSRSGKKVGYLRDFSFDTTTDALCTFETSKKFLFWEWDFRQFSKKDIQEITEKALILTVDDEQMEKGAKVVADMLSS